MFLKTSNLAGTFYTRRTLFALAAWPSLAGHAQTPPPLKIGVLYNMPISDLG